MEEAEKEHLLKRCSTQNMCTLATFSVVFDIFIFVENNYYAYSLY